MDTVPAPATGELLYRDATGVDVEQLVALVESAYRGVSSQLGWTTEADLLEGQRTDSQGVLDIVRVRAAACSWPSGTAS